MDRAQGRRRIGGKVDVIIAKDRHIRRHGKAPVVKLGNQQHGNLVVAADGAASLLAELGVEPDVVIGDLDTVDPEFIEERSDEIEVVRDPGQEKYDGEKGLRFLVTNGSDDILVVGAGGGMIDHVLNNFSILTRYAAEVRITTTDDHCTGYFVTDRLSIDTKEGERISIIPMPGAQVQTKGLHWEINGSVLAWSVREGASNRATGDQVSITVRNGTVILFHYPSDRA